MRNSRPEMWLLLASSSVYMLSTRRKSGGFTRRRYPFIYTTLFTIIYLSVRLFCRLKRVLVGHWLDWPSSATVLAAVSARSAGGPVRRVSDILMAAGAYRVGYLFAVVS